LRPPLGRSLGGFFGRLEVFTEYGNGGTGGFFFATLSLELLPVIVGTVPLEADCLDKS